MNKNIFKSAAPVLPMANTVNNAGGLAFSMEDEEALAQLACTGTFNGTYYASGTDTLADVLRLAKTVSPEFLAKLAVYSRESAFMKDSSAVLLAVLMTRNINLFCQVFDRVIDNGKMLKNFCQVVRSGQVGRKSFGSAPKRMIKKWLENRSDKHLFEDSVGNDPSLSDVIKMVHPKPANANREAFYKYLIGKKVENTSLLPLNVQEFEAFKLAPKGSRTVPNVPFQMLTALDLSNKEWTDIAKNAKWHMTRMNLNTFERHAVFSEPGMIDMISTRLKSEKDIRNSKVFPYQLFIAYMSATTVPTKVKNALQDAMEIATQNTPKIAGKVFVGVDCSGSMGAAVTGNRGTATTQVNCNQVASLMAACILRNTEDSCTVYRFDTHASLLTLNPRDSVMTNSQKIGLSGGGTDCGAMLRTMNSNKDKADVVFILSDNESWSNPYSGMSTNLMKEWTVFKAHNPKAKLVCVDLAANTTKQVAAQKDILCVGGFSDNVWPVVEAFLEDGKTSWVDKIKQSVTLSA